MVATFGYYYEVVQASIKKCIPERRGIHGKNLYYAERSVLAPAGVSEGSRKIFSRLQPLLCHQINPFSSTRNNSSI